MTDEQIKKLAKEYTEDALEDWCTENGQFVEPWHCVVADLSFIAAKAIQNISKTHCIVEKEEILSDYEFNAGCFAQFSASAEDRCRKIAEWHKGKCDELESLFGKEFF